MTRLPVRMPATQANSSPLLPPRLLPWGAGRGQAPLSPEAEAALEPHCRASGGRRAGGMCYLVSKLARG